MIIVMTEDAVTGIIFYLVTEEDATYLEMTMIVVEDVAEEETTMFLELKITAEDDVEENVAVTSFNSWNGTPC
ncbi:hypothetical protein [Rossellomorea sp. y25]